MTMKTTKSQINVLLDVLREFLRARGLRTREIAETLNVTERTVMRWFASEAVDTRVLERLCGLIDISFFELCEMAAKRVETRLTQLTVQQEQALVDYPLLNYLFVHALKGWSSAELQSEMDIPEPMFVDALIRLEKIGLIGLFPGNEIRLRTAKDIQWRKGGPYSRYMDMFLKWSLNSPDIAEPKSLWIIEPLKLSSGSLSQLQRKFDALKGEAVSLSEQDRRSNDMSREWFSLVLTARRIEMTPLSEWPTQYQATGERRRERNGKL
ncbi:MAG: family transcriptional regulator [Rhodospirillales bacterium]|nr:family transcriptional regulator [Rhodospirillales bacterium]